MLKQTIEKLISRENLTKEESSLAIHEALGEANPFQTACIPRLMRAKGETIEEIQGVIEAMRSLMVRVDVHVLSSTWSAQEASAPILSTSQRHWRSWPPAAALKSPKHGNRSVSSLAGSADVLEATGIDIHQTPEQIEVCLVLKRSESDLCSLPIFTLL